jgi:hypothetical protein
MKTKTAFIPPIVSALLGAAHDSATEARAKISNVKYAPYSAGDRYTKIQFDFAGVAYAGELKGRNRDFVLSLDGGEGDKSIALRCMLDGDAILK